MTTERPRPAKVYTMADLQPIIDGKMPVPNLEEFPSPEAGLQALCFGLKEGGIGRALTDAFGRDRYGAYARYYLGTGQMGDLDGTGIVIWYHTEHEPKYRTIGRIARWAICKHKKVEGPGANHMRGWHPGWCESCGMNMDVDSGD